MNLSAAAVFRFFHPSIIYISIFSSLSLCYFFFNSCFVIRRSSRCRRPHTHIHWKRRRRPFPNPAPPPPPPFSISFILCFWNTYRTTLPDILYTSSSCISLYFYFFVCMYYYYYFYHTYLSILSLFPIPPTLFLSFRSLFFSPSIYFSPPFGSLLFSLLLSHSLSLLLHS